MPAGEAFSVRQQEEILRAIRAAEESSALRYSVFVGALGDEPRLHAHRLHAALAQPRDSVLVAVDPAARQLEIVTGAAARRRLDDRACGLAAASMTSTFLAGDLAGGIAQGLQLLAEHARQPRTLHLDQP